MDSIFIFVWSNYADHFGVKSGPTSCLKTGLKIDPEQKMGPGNLPPAGKGPGRVLFHKMQVLEGA